MYKIEQTLCKTFKLSGPGIDQITLDSFDEAYRIKTICEILRKFYEEKMLLTVKEVFDHSSMVYFKK